MTASYIPNVYHVDGSPVPVSEGPVIYYLYPPGREGASFPSPAQAAKNVMAAIAALTPQPSIL